MNSNVVNESVQSLLTAIAQTAVASKNNTKSGGGYMGLVKTAGGQFMAVKFLTHHYERGSHYDRTIVENCMHRENEIFFNASENLERTLLDLASKAGKEAEKEVQDLLSDWRTKSGCGGKTLLSRNVVFKAVKAINAGLGEGDKVDLATIRSQESVKDTSMETLLRGLRNKGVLPGNAQDESPTAGHLKKLKADHAKSINESEKMAETRKKIGNLEKSIPKMPNLLTRDDRDILETILSASALPDDNFKSEYGLKSGRGYMGLTLSNGVLVPLRFLTHYSERGANSDRTIMKNISEKGEVGTLAFKSSELLEKVLLKLAAKVNRKKEVSDLFEDWKRKSQHNNLTILSREVVFNAVSMINISNMERQVVQQVTIYADPLPVQSDTRIEQLNSLDAAQNLQTLENLLNGNKSVDKEALK